MSRFVVSGTDTALDFQEPGTTSAAITAATGSPWLAAIQGVKSFLTPKPLNLPQVQDTAPISDSTPPGTVAAYLIMGTFVVGAAGLLFYLLKK